MFFDIYTAMLSAFQFLDNNKQLFSQLPEQRIILHTSHLECRNII